MANVGGFAVEVHPSNALGHEKESLRQIARGLVQITLGAATAPASMSPLLRVTILPFLFAGTEEFDRVMAETDMLDHLNAPVLCHCVIGANGTFARGFPGRALRSSSGAMNLPMMWVTVAVALSFSIVLIHLAARWAGDNRGLKSNLLI